VEPVFSIRLHDKDLATLKLIQAYFEGIGKIYHHDQISEATFRVGCALLGLISQLGRGPDTVVESVADTTPRSERKRRPKIA
jgi:hypothetical protein